MGVKLGLSHEGRKDCILEQGAEENIWT